MMNSNRTPTTEKNRSSQTAAEQPANEEPIVEEVIEANPNMPNMLDTIWEAEDLGIQGGFMYYYPDSK